MASSTGVPALDPPVRPTRATARTPRGGGNGSNTGPTAKRRTKGAHVIAWIERYCVHTNGEWIGRPFRLLPWQKKLIYELFEVGSDNKRRCRWAYRVPPDLQSISPGLIIGRPFAPCFRLKLMAMRNLSGASLSSSSASNFLGCAF